MGNEIQELMSGVAKNQEGVLLGLASIGDSLIKIDGRLSKMDEAEEKAEELRQAEELKKAKEDFAKEVAITAANILKEDKVGIDVDGATMRDVNHEDVFDSGGGVGDEQEDDNVTTEIKDVQRPLQLMMKELRKEMKQDMKAIMKHMLKEHAHMYEGDDESAAGGDVMDEVMTEDAEEDMAVGMDDEMDMGDDEDGDSEWGMEESADFPVEDEDYEDDDFDKMYKSVSKNPAAFKKFVKSQQAQIKKQAKKQAEAILKQQGFVQDKGVMPKKTSATNKTLGLDDSIIKGNNKAGSKSPLIDVVKTNSERSWEALAQDYVDHYDTKTPSGIITDEIRELYG